MRTKADAVDLLFDRHQPGRRRPVIGHGPHGKRGRVRSTAGLRHLRRHPLGASHHLHPPGLAVQESELPLYVVDNGRSLREDAKALTNHSGNESFIDIPVYLKGTDGSGDGMGRRQCTEHYKIRPVRRKIRELLGLSRGQRVPADTTVELWLGISTDEAIRMKTSRDRWIHNRYPLIAVGMSRKDCLEWWEGRYDRPLEGSACVGCPYQSRQRWVETKRRFPELFREAVDCWQSAQVGQIRTREDYYYEELRVSSLRVLL